MEVTCEDTFDCIVRLVNAGYNPVALDFASGTTPGGAWRKSNQQGTQEESLCRRSNLGLLLEKKKYPIPQDGHYYIPNVIITDTKIKCAIIASELRGIAASKHEYLVSRVESIYKCAITNKHDVLILGAWGCGAFKETEDDVEIMANLFKIVANKYADKIKSVFSVLYKRNYTTFKKCCV
jgi:hypothetical protein